MNEAIQGRESFGWEGGYMIEGTTLVTQVALAVESIKNERLETAKIYLEGGETEVISKMEMDGKINYLVAGVILETLTTPLVISAIQSREQRV